MTPGPSDMVAGLRRYELWWALAWNDLRSGNHRSRIGVFWHSFAFFIVVAAMAFLYSNLLRVPGSMYAPYLGAGLLIWRFINQVLVGALAVLRRNQGFLTQTPLPISVFIYRLTLLQLLTMGLNAVGFLAILALWQVVLEPRWGALLLGLLILVVSSVGAALMLSMLAVFWAALRNLVPPILNLLFFVTPILWMPELIVQIAGAADGDGQWSARLLRASLVTYNPFYHFLEVIRAPLLGELPSPTSWAVATVLAGGLLATGVWMLNRHRRRLLVRL